MVACWLHLQLCHSSSGGSESPVREGGSGGREGKRGKGGEERILLYAAKHWQQSLSGKAYAPTVGSWSLVLEGAEKTLFAKYYMSVLSFLRST